MRLTLESTMLALIVTAALVLPARAADEPALPKPAIEFTTDHSEPQRKVRRFTDPYAGEIFDALIHLTPPSSGKSKPGQNVSVPDEMKDAGVTWTVLMPTPNSGLGDKAESSGENISIAKHSSGKILAFCGGDTLSTWMDSVQESGYLETSLRGRIDRLSQDLATGTCTGIGEFGLFHFNKSGDQNIIHLRPTFTPVLETIALAERSGKWIQVHAEPTEPDGTSHIADVLGALALWYERAPQLKMILSHTEMTNPDNVRRILTAYPTLMMSIKLAPRNENWTHLEPVTNRRAEFYEDWAKLFDDMPDRFIVGSDTKFASGKHDSGEKYARTIEQYRGALGSLSPAAAEAIANGNARRMFGK